MSQIFDGNQTKLEAHSSSKRRARSVNPPKIKVDTPIASKNTLSHLARYNQRHRVPSTPVELHIEKATTSMQATKPCCIISVMPPVFPRQQSLYDENLRGGFYEDTKQDAILMRAIKDARCRANDTLTQKTNILRSHSPIGVDDTESFQTKIDLKDSVNLSVKSLIESPLMSPRIKYTTDLDDQSDSGHESLDSRFSIVRLDNNGDRYQSFADDSVTKTYNGKFYTSRVNQTGTDNVDNDAVFYSTNDLLMREPAKTNFLRVKNSNAFGRSLKSILKAESLSKMVESRSNLVSESYDNNSNSDYSVEKIGQTDSNIDKMNRQRKKTYLFNRYFKRKPSHATFYYAHDNALSHADRDDTDAPQKSATCHADSAFAMHWRKLIRTLSGGISTSRNSEKPSAESLGARRGANLNREWEVVTVRELCRRLSLEDSLEPSEMPLPEGALHSRILDEFMIRQIVDILPPRAEGYPWVNIYSSEKHGFSLATLYRKMSEWTEEMSPVLLVIRDANLHVFGAVASTALRPNEHYYGTGDSCLLFRFTGEFPHTRELRSYTWTGENQFFVNATRNFLAMGGGGGAYGLWLDADLNHGRSQRCATFDNEPLAGSTTAAGSIASSAVVDIDGGDFIVQHVEVFGFSMS